MEVIRLPGRFIRNRHGDKRSGLYVRAFIHVRVHYIGKQKSASRSDAADIIVNFKRVVNAFHRIGFIDDLIFGTCPISLVA